MYHLPFSSVVEALDMLQVLEVKIDTESILAYWGDTLRQRRMNTTEKFKYWRLLAQKNKKTALDSILRYAQSTVFEGLYFGKPAQNLWDNHIQTTLLAYQILQTVGGQADWSKSATFSCPNKANLPTATPTR